MQLKIIFIMVIFSFNLIFAAKVHDFKLKDIENKRKSYYELKGDNNIPEKPHLYQNYPNPFNPVTNIIFEIKESQKVILQIYNIEGRLIKTLIENQLFAGRHELSWNGLNSQGLSVASGVYYYVLRAGDYQSAKRMVLMR